MKKYTITIGEETADILTDIPSGGNINTIEAAIFSYEVRTDNPTMKGFIDYVKSKGIYTIELVNL